MPDVMTWEPDVGPIHHSGFRLQGPVFVIIVSSTRVSSVKFRGDKGRVGENLRLEGKRDRVSGNC